MMYDQPGTETEGPLRPTPGRDDEAVTNFLHALGRALSQGKPDVVASLWETPALVVADQGVIAVGARAEVERFFAGAAAQYTSQGITSTRPEVTRLGWISDRIAIVEVLWQQLDVHGDRRGEEGVTYTLRRDDSGELKIRAAVTHPPLEPV